MAKDPNEIKPTPMQQTTLGWTIQALAEGLTARSLADLVRSAKRAEKYLNELFELFSEKLKFPEEAPSYHTYLRKFCDDHITTAIYLMVSNGAGMATWCAFLNELEKPGRDYPAMAAINAAKEASEQGSLNDIILCCLIEAWGEDEIEEARSFIHKTAAAHKEAS
jgi:hypothetical protein